MYPTRWAGLTKAFSLKLMTLSSAYAEHRGNKIVKAKQSIILVFNRLLRLIHNNSVIILSSNAFIRPAFWL